jgi:hypothetical protein
MALTRRSALLGALGIGVASRLPAIPVTEAVVAAAPVAAPVAAPGALVAAGGWCAPSETLYSLADMGTLDGVLTLPNVTVKRGGIKYGGN